MRTRFLLVATTALLLFGALPAQAQDADVGIKNPESSTPTTLYFHVINVQDMPINTQLPDPAFSAGQGFGAGTNTLRCLNPYTGDIGGTGVGTRGTTSQVFHTAYGYSSPSYVEYDFVSANGDPRTHPERGISYDALFDKSTPFTIDWFVAVFNGEGQAQDQVPTPTPNMKVKAIMRAGDAISVDDKAYDSGPTLAEGETEPVSLVPAAGRAVTSTGGDSTQVTYEGQDGGKHLYKFTIPLDYQADMVQRATGFNVRIDMYIDTPDGFCRSTEDVEKDYIMTSTVAAYSSAEHRPLMSLAIMNPIRLEYLHPQFVGDDLVVHTSMNSAWGNYDVDETSADGILVSIEGPSPATSLAKAALVQRYHEHYHHQEAVDVTYVWPYKTDRAQNGLYTVFVEFGNDQKTARASGTAQFEIGKGIVIGCGGIQESQQKLNDECAVSEQTDGKAEAADAPGLPIVGALAAIGAAAVLLRRRQA